jgi:galactonate dehydratase
MNGAGRMAAIDTAARTGEVVDRLAAVRAAIGPDRDVVVDFHGRMSAAMSRRILPLLEPLFPLFVEEAALPENGHQLRSLVECSAVPLATGERLFSRWDFREVLTTGIAVAQPDLSHAGGISEVRRIAAMAEAYGVSLAPHCPLGPIALAASLQVGFATPNLLIQEQSVGIHYNEGNELLDYLIDPTPLQFRDGYAAPPTRPGLGIEIDERAVARAAETGHRWRNPVWRDSDGALREW